ncbi:MAG: restriction endonuclease, partial [Gammaproteobacteria bacterium]
MSWHRRKSYKSSPEYGCALLLAIIGLAIYTNNQQILSILIPLTVLGVIGFIIYLVYKRYQYDKLASTGIFDIDEMEGTEFENRLKILFENLGYQVEHTGRSGDAGVDLIIRKYGQKTAVQAKRYEGHVGVSAVQEVHTGMDYYDCDRAIIVTNSRFTDEALRVAQKTHIKLWNRNYLIKVLQTE